MQWLSGSNLDAGQIGRVTMDSATANGAMLRKFKELCNKEEKPLREDFDPISEQVHCLSHAVSCVCTKIMVGFKANASEGSDDLYIENTKVQYKSIIITVSVELVSGLSTHGKLDRFV